MDKFICQIDNEEFTTEKELHKHLRKHKMRIVEYYQTYYPRYDKHTGDIIKFKNKEQYLNTDFNSRTNLRMWLKSISEEEAKQYCRNLLIERKEKKDLEFAPTQVELRSIMSPPIQYYNQLFGDYYELCSKLGLEARHAHCTEIITGKAYDSNEYTIHVDTREQRPLKFNRPIELKTLKYGDYTFSDGKAACDCYIERKSLVDLIGTLSGGYDRFCKEIERSIEDGANFIVIVEAKLADALYFNQIRKSGGRGRVYGKVRATPEFIFHRLRNLVQEYPYIQFLFVNGRKESARVVEKIFTSGGIYKKIDLQLAYDLGKL